MRKYMRANTLRASCVLLTGCLALSLTQLAFVNSDTGGDANVPQVTWVNFHLQLARTFWQPYKEWPSEKISTELAPIDQPCIAMGPGEELFVNGNKGQVFHSTDGGQTWTQFARFTDHSSEPSLLELPAGKIVASVRYQRGKMPEDPPNLASCHNSLEVLGDDFTSGTDMGVTVFQNTAFTYSEDGGRIWAPSRLVTGKSQQTGTINRLSDGTLIVTFGRWGQRFMLSYDEGESWSQAVHQLNGTGEYARSVVLSDDTIVTVHDRIGEGAPPAPCGNSLEGSVSGRRRTPRLLCAPGV